MTKSLPQILEEANSEIAEIRKKQEEAMRLEARRKELTHITEAIQGLSSTQEKSKQRGYDPGKCDTAYYFVEKMTENNILESREFKPGVMQKCPDCGSEVPVMMSYTQTYDSPEGDWWAKRAFYICCGKLRVIRSLGNENRF